MLDEADKIQPNQPQSINLRFKAHYALAYIEYRKQNYPGALAELDPRRPDPEKTPTRTTCAG